MNITVEYKSFLTLLKNCNACAGARDSVWIGTKEGIGHIEFMSQDGIYEYSAPFTPQIITEEGRINVLFKTLYTYVKNINKDFSLVTKGNDCSLVYDGGSITFPTRAGVYMEPMKPGDFFYIEQCKTAIESVRHCADLPGTPLENLSFVKRGDTLEVAALNGVLFALKKLPCPSEYTEEQMLIRASVLAPILRFLDDACLFSITDKRFFIKNADDVIFSVPRGVDATYPEYQVFLNAFADESALYSVTVNKDALEKCLERITYTDEENVTLHFDNEKLYITSTSNNCTIEDIIELKDSKGTIIQSISFDVENMVNILSNFNTKNDILIRMTGETSPCSIQETNNSDYITIIMPCIV